MNGIVSPVRIARRDLGVLMNSQRDADVAIHAGYVAVSRQGGRGTQTLVWLDSCHDLIDEMKSGRIDLDPESPLTAALLKFRVESGRPATKTEREAIAARLEGGAR